MQVVMRRGLLMVVKVEVRRSRMLLMHVMRLMLLTVLSVMLLLVLVVEMR